MNFNIIIVIVITVITSNVKGICLSEETLYTCQTKDEELRCSCPDLKNKVRMNCTCFTTEYRDCLEALRKGQTESGIFLLKPDNMAPFKVYCDMETDGGGWTVFQKRMDGSVDFYRNWNDYLYGFGNILGEYWLGLRKIYHLANSDVSTQLRVDMRDKNGTSAYASYSTFYIGGSTTDYTLHVSGYKGTAGDSLKIHNLMRFSTKDNDNDQNSGKCAVTFTGAWWYESCHSSNLNGKYGNDAYGKGVLWGPWRGHYHSLPFTEMKVRRV